jgi:GTP pyrophosphokinase
MEHKAKVAIHTTNTKPKRQTDCDFQVMCDALNQKIIDFDDLPFAQQICVIAPKIQVVNGIKAIDANISTPDTNTHNAIIKPETAKVHAHNVYAILAQLDISAHMAQACVLFPAYPSIQKHDLNFIDADVHDLSASVYKLLQTTQQFTEHTGRINQNLEHHASLEVLRKMLLASAQDIRAIVIMLASQLQTLRWCAEQKHMPHLLWVQDILNLYAPLANRLGIWQLKWELEDLAFRFIEPQLYREIASLLDEKRTEREQFIEQMKEKLLHTMQENEIEADISGRPKHIYSIWKKMRGKNISFGHLYDVRAFRIIVKNIKDCYAVLGVVHNLWTPIPKEFDDYISQAKPNGYQSLHTVVIADDGRAIEIQIRTEDMHKQAEFGVSAHWRYKEEGSKGYSGQFSASSNYEEKISVLRKLLEWKDESDAYIQNLQIQNNIKNQKIQQKAATIPTAISNESETMPEEALAPEQRWEKVGTWVDDHIYVFTPQNKVIALPIGSTALDFAYHVHTDIGHRCRGAKANGKMIPLYKPIENGQTIEIITVKNGAPSRNWLRTQPIYLMSARARSKVRAWFNALELEETIEKGRALVEKFLQREGKTSIALEDLAHYCQFKNTNDLFLNVAKDLVSSKVIEEALNLHHINTQLHKKEVRTKEYKEKDKDKDKTTHGLNATNIINGILLDNNLLPKNKRKTPKQTKTKLNQIGVHVMGLDSLVMQIAKCCKPLPGDDIIGFITKGKGISIHRKECLNLAKYQQLSPERIIEAEWSQQHIHQTYMVDVYIEAHDRQGLLRDLGNVFSKEKINVVRSYSDNKNDIARMTFTLEFDHTNKLQEALRSIQNVKSVTKVKRKTTLN